MSEFPPPYPPYQSPVDPQDRTFATLAHVGTLANLLGLWGWLVPLVILLTKGNRPVVRRAAAESLNFQISFGIYAVVFGVLSFILIGLPFLFAVAVMMLVMPIIAAIKTNEGIAYKYPLTFRLIK
jgi:hypothetical protein